MANLRRKLAAPNSRPYSPHSPCVGYLLEDDELDFAWLTEAKARSTDPFAALGLTYASSSSRTPSSPAGMSVAASDYWTS